MDGQLQNYVGKENHLMQKDGRFVDVYDQTQESGKIISAIMLAIADRLKESSQHNEDALP